jgi:hypothetical protein
MNANWNLLGTDERHSDREGQEEAVRRIGEVLPQVMARYQLGALDPLCELSEEFSI